MTDNCVIWEQLITVTNRFARSERKYCCCRLLKYSSQETKLIHVSMWLTHSSLAIKSLASPVVSLCSVYMNKTATQYS